MLVRRYRQETVVMATAIVAHVLYRRLVARTLGMDLFARLRLRGEVVLGRDEVVREVRAVRDRLVDLQANGRVHLYHDLVHADPEAIVERALSVWSGYHTRTAAKDLGPEITAEDPTLLLYYQNRLVPFALDLCDESDLPAAREIAAIGRKL